MTLPSFPLIMKVSNFTEEGLVTPEREKHIFKVNLSMQGIEPGLKRQEC
jgi:hypothetical protein